MEFYRITTIRKCCDDIKMFQFVPVEGKLMEYKPGHFLTLHLLDENRKSIDSRPYSIASSPTQEYIELAIKIINGKFTSKLDKVKEGEIVGIEGPFGSFTYDDQKKCAFVGGGTGVAPLIGMLRYIDTKKIRGKFILFFSCRKKEDMPYSDELQKLSRNPNIEIICFLFNLYLKY